MPRRTAVNLDSVESVSVGVLVDRLGTLTNERMSQVCEALEKIAIDCGRGPIDEHPSRVVPRPSSGAGAMRWWDGERWTKEHVNVPTLPPPPVPRPLLRGRVDPASADHDGRRHPHPAGRGLPRLTAPGPDRWPVVRERSVAAGVRASRSRCSGSPRARGHVAPALRAVEEDAVAGHLAHRGLGGGRRLGRRGGGRGRGRRRHGRRR